VTAAARGAALEAIAAEVRACTRCRLHEARTLAVPGEGHPETEVVFVGEGPGFNKDRLGRPFVGRAGDFLVRLLASIGWSREDVFITNVVKCRPPENRDPEPDEIAACGEFLRRQLDVLDPALVVTLGRHSLGRFMPGTTITRAHGTLRPVDPATGAAGAMVYALYHPAAALRSTDLAETSLADAAGIPAALEEARARRIEEADPRQADAPSSAHVAPADAPAPAAQLSAPASQFRSPPEPGSATPAPGAAPHPDLPTDNAPADATNQLTLFG
jgi:uracil-DNA glycosylase